MTFKELYLELQERIKEKDKTIADLKDRIEKGTLCCIKHTNEIAELKELNEKFRKILLDNQVPYHIEYSNRPKGQGGKRKTGFCSVCGDPIIFCEGCGKEFSDDEDVIHNEDDFGEKNHYCKSCR